VDLKEDDLVEFAKKTTGDTGLKECQKLVNDFVESHFGRHPLKSVDPATMSIPDDVLLELVRYARLISVGRVEVIGEMGGFVAEALKARTASYFR